MNWLACAAGIYSIRTKIRIFLDSKITVDSNCSQNIKRPLLFGRELVTNLDNMLKSRDITFLTKACIVKAMVFPSHVRTWELDPREGWALKNWCFWNVLKKTLESSLDCKAIQPVSPKGNQSWLFIGRTDAETEAPILWPLDAKN